MSDESEKNPGETPTPQLTGRARSLANLRKPWVKGQPSANPGGRPKGLAKQIREMTNDFELQTKRMIEISLGRVQGASVRDQIEATKWLADRGVGKVAETHLKGELDQDATRDLLADMATEDLLDLIGQLKKTA